MSERAPLVEEGALAPVTRPGDLAVSPYAAVLWDMDGTLVDTEPYWMETEYALAEKYGGTWNEEHSLNLVGNDLLESGRYIREHMGIDREPAEIVEELLDGVVEQIRVGCRGGRVRWSCWRTCGRRVCVARWSRCPTCASSADPGRAARGTFEAVVTGDAVERGKPYPDPYLKAARLLAVDPADCLAIEDSDPGARSAETAGCPVLCVPNHVPVPHGGRRMFVDSLEGLSAGNLPVLG